jgi:quercetin 2,3-dioxygenase
MDDRLNKQNGEPVGGPHPHAGFETVSLLLEGEMGDGAYTMKGGDLQIMTAGSGIIPGTSSLWIKLDNSILRSTEI